MTNHVSAYNNRWWGEREINLLEERWLGFKPRHDIIVVEEEASRRMEGVVVFLVLHFVRAKVRRNDV